MTPTQEQSLMDAKQRELIFALEEIEGKVMSMQEILHLGYLIRIQWEGRPGEEMIDWRGDHILHFKWNKKGELRTLKLYAKS